MLYGGVGGDFTVGTAEAKVVSEVYKGNKGRYGFSGEVGAQPLASNMKSRVKAISLALSAAKAKSAAQLAGLAHQPAGRSSAIKPIIP